MSNVVSIGPHSVAYEPESGFIIIRHVGELEVAHAAPLGEAMARFAKPDEPTFVLADTTKASALSPQARQAMMANPDDARSSFVAVYGAGFTYRVLVNMVLKIVTLTSPKVVTQIFAQEAEARAWLGEKKREWTAKHPLRGGA